MFRAAVPKTAFHEHGQSKFREYKIRLAKDRLISPPTSDVMPTEECG